MAGVVPTPTAGDDGDAPVGRGRACVVDYSMRDVHGERGIECVGASERIVESNGLCVEDVLSGHEEREERSVTL